MTLRDVCDLAYLLMVEQARRDAQTLALTAVMGGGEYADPVHELVLELATPPVVRPDADLRKALGLSA